MMKQGIPLLSLVAFLFSSSSVLAEGYGGKCLYLDRGKSENKFHACLVTPTPTHLEVTFASNNRQDGNKVIVGNRITQIASGNFAKRLLSDSGSIIGGILFAPLGIASRLFSKDYQIYVLDYSQQGKALATAVQIDIKEAPAFQQDLRTLAGNLLVRFEPPKKSTVIDIGPDIK